MHLMDLDLASAYLRYVLNSISVVCLHYAGLKQNWFSKILLKYPISLFGLSGQSFVSLFIICVFGIQCCLVFEQFGIQLLEKEQHLRDHVAATPSQRWHDCRSHNNFSFKMLFPFVFLIPWGSYRVCITAATGLSLSIKSDRLWHCRLTLTSIHSPLCLSIKNKGVSLLLLLFQSF